ncbi:hypothetical protein HCDG_00289 [Histoplasma capsulatum H143]|uniref:Uncharacterized protein n=1 Tax=Ajellomyces capsulatus (strain H143) TaxID=544712 RepID=C6H4W8_AJECH|nr:hypothetical protein HCDG_00289 [Histoplasma capsulatum H143]
MKLLWNHRNELGVGSAVTGGSFQSRLWTSASPHRVITENWNASVELCLQESSEHGGNSYVAVRSNKSAALVGIGTLTSHPGEGNDSSQQSLLKRYLEEAFFYSFYPIFIRGFLKSVRSVIILQNLLAGRERQLLNFQYSDALFEEHCQLQFIGRDLLQACSRSPTAGAAIARHPLL